ncbi:alpha-keto acid decarboxylase family protein [Aspergillus udagawae]|uniref:Pyruvate decarboxylase n=1 Tax=Aspergillus udagawae TaxID=91492 RepID=A0A8E0USH3_9EURO|nr:uncharacterized protein Aud_000036 [Aspergillus udagawae]GIC84222.1 hypothetical protein Aud_000036 [Aspergillus udagawae]
MADTVSVSGYLFTRLYQLGVRSIFGVPGDFSLPALDYVDPSGLKWMGTASELTAGYAADGYARITGLAALFTVFGVGELSAVAAIAGSYAEKVPVVHIVGTPSTDAQDNRLVIHHTLGDGNFRVMADVYRHFTCAQANLRDFTAAPALVDTTLQQCIRQSRPVYIELPFDVIHLQVSAAPLRQALDCRPPPNDPAMEQMVVDEITCSLQTSKEPFIVVDGFAHRYGIRKEVNTLLRLTGYPTATTPFGKSIVDETYPHFHGVYTGSAGNTPLHKWIQSCDLVIHIGPLKSDCNTYAFTSLTRAQCTIELNHNRVSIFGTEYRGLGIQSVLRELIFTLPSSQLSPLAPSLTVQPRQPVAKASNVTQSITQLRFWSHISMHFRSTDIIMVDAGTPWSGSEDFILPPGAILIKSGIWMSTGHMLGASTGVAKAQQETKEGKQLPIPRTIVFEGDGSFQMTVQAVSDIIRHSLHVIVFVINNQGYTIERIIHGMGAVYNSIQPWDYTAAAGFFGAPEKDPDFPVATFRVAKWSELDSVLASDQLNKGRGLTLVEVQMGMEDAPCLLKEFIALHPKQKRQDPGTPGKQSRLPGLPVFHAEPPNHNPHN